VLHQRDYSFEMSSRLWLIAAVLILCLLSTFVAPFKLSNKSLMHSTKLLADRYNQRQGSYESETVDFSDLKSLMAPRYSAPQAILDVPSDEKDSYDVNMSIHLNYVIGRESYS
jgi:hypothetical protein